jgi:hypothetical protein
MKRITSLRGDFNVGTVDEMISIIISPAECEFNIFLSLDTKLFNTVVNNNVQLTSCALFK